VCDFRETVTPPSTPNNKKKLSVEKLKELCAAIGYPIISLEVMK